MMTNEEKIELVEEALDGKLLVAEAREAFVDYFDELYFRFYTGCVSGGPTRRCGYFMQKLARVVGEARCDAIREEEWNNWEASARVQSEPEILELYLRGTEEEIRNFPAGTDSDAIEEWLADRRGNPYRHEYAQKFYGAAV